MDDTGFVPWKLVRRELAERVLLGRMPDAEADRFLAGLERASTEAAGGVPVSMLDALAQVEANVDDLGRFFADRIEQAWMVNQGSAWDHELAVVAGMAIAGFFHDTMASAAETMEGL